METIDDCDVLYRRILQSAYNYRRKVLAPALFMRFKAPDPSISVFIARLTTPDELLVEEHGKSGIAVNRAGDARHLGFTVRPDPDHGGPAHAAIEGVTDDDSVDLLLEVTRVQLPPVHPGTGQRPQV